MKSYFSTTWQRYDPDEHGHISFKDAVPFVRELMQSMPALPRPAPEGV